MFLVVPSCALQKDAIDVAAVLWFLSHLGVGHIVKDSELEGNTIDSDVFLTCEVLECPCDESLWEEETSNPEDLRGAVIDPFLQERDPVSEILSP